MVTEEPKKEGLVKVMNIAMYGMIEGLWDLFGESAFATVHSIGDKILSAMEKEADLEVAGEDLEGIIMELSRLMVDEYGLMTSVKPVVKDKKVSIACKECFLRQATGWLEEADVQPFVCIPMNVTAAAMHKRLGIKHRLLGRDWDPKTQTCTINFEIL